MTMVAGAAGIGKTFLKGQVFKKSYAAGDVCKFDIKDLYRNWQASGWVEEKPDLYSGETVLNWLLGIKEQQKAGRCLLEFLNEQSAAFYVIDSLDEVHPDDYQWILDQVEQFVFQEDKPFVEVVLFGRGLAFREYWQSKDPSDRSGDVRLFMLNPPRFKTTGDLLVSNWNYDSYRYKLKWAPDHQTPTQMPLENYRQWVADDYRLTGNFSTVTFESNDSMNPKTRGRLQAWSQQ
jgi:hypothetical protein